MFESLSRSTTTLREAGQAKGVMMGAAFNLNYISDSNYANTFLTQYGIGTAENACKWGAIRPSQDKFNFDSCVDHFKLAIENGQEFRGHNLCWGMWNPKWLEDFSGTADELDAILKEHITTVMQKVRQLAGGNKILAWDVVNEAIADGSGTFKDAKPWYPLLPDYVDRAFKYARQADPDA